MFFLEIMNLFYWGFRFLFR